MKIVTCTIFLNGILAVSAASIRSQIAANNINENKAEDFTDNSTRNDSVQFLPPSETWGSQREMVSPESTTTISLSNPPNDTKWHKGLPANLIQKITTILQKGQSSLNNQYDPNKQLFGGRLPPFIERIIQRIQNYFSVYNPPEYFENNRPPQAQNEGLTIICSNSANESLSCNEANEEGHPNEQENPEICDFNSSESTDPCDIDPNSIKCAQTNQQTAQNEYNVVVTHTVVQDSSLNVYSPADATHTVSNVVVILEPSRAEYSLPVENATNRNKFYVYVNPTAASVNTKTTTDEKDEQKTWNQNATGNRGNVQPYVNTTYTVIIRADKLEEYSSNVDNADNESLNPDIAVFTKNSVANASRLTSCKPVESAIHINCSRQRRNDSNPLSVELSASVASRSITSTANTQTKNNNKVPDIDLALVPPDYNAFNNKNKSSCLSSIDKATSSPPNLEFYVLKPNIVNNTTARDKEKQTFRLHKTYIEGVASPTYLPPNHQQLDDIEDQSANNIDTVTTRHQNVTRSTLLFDLFKTYAEKSTAVPVSLKEIQ